MAKGFCDRRAIVFLSSKGAINSAVKSLAIEVSRLGIRVNAVLPGFVMTEMIESWQEVYTKEYSYPLGIGKVQDVVEPIKQNG